MSLINSSTLLSNGIFLGLVAGIPAFGMIKKINIYESFVTGAKGGFELAITIIPYLVAIIVAISMLRASGAFTNIAGWLAPLFQKLGLSTDIIPLALIRPFSGSGANGLLAELIGHHGGNAYVSHVAATMVGSTETTFYVIAVYFGAAKITRSRYAIPAGLLADLAGIIAAIVVCYYLLPH